MLIPEKNHKRNIPKSKGMNISILFTHLLEEAIARTGKTQIMYIEVIQTLTITHIPVLANTNMVVKSILIQLQAMENESIHDWILNQSINDK